MHRITLKDVAAQAQVSVTTASLVLNGRPARVSQDTRERILSAAKTLNYVPNQNARSLVTKKSMLIALIVPDIENLFFASLARQIEASCKANGYSLIVANSNDSRANEHELMVRLASLGIDGMLLITARDSYDHLEDLQHDVERMDCPVMLVDRLFAEQWCDGSGIDNYSGGQLAAACLVDAGHRIIGCVTGGDQRGNAADRVHGFMDYLRDHDVACDPNLEFNGRYRFRGGYDAADAIIDGGATAVFCCNDLMAAGFIQRCAERGLKVPQDISVIGYDNILERYGLFREITSVEQRIEELAEKSWAQLHTRIQELQHAGKKRAGSESAIAAAATVAGDANETEEAGSAAVTVHGTDKPWLTQAQTILLQPHLVIRSTVGEL